MFIKKTCSENEDEHIFYLNALMRQRYSLLNDDENINSVEVVKTISLGSPNSMLMENREIK